VARQELIYRLHGKASQRQNRTGDRRFARDRQGRGARARPRRRACHRARTHRRRARRTRRRHPESRRHRHARAGRPEGRAGHRSPRGKPVRALQASRRAGRQCRDPRHALAARSFRSESLGRCDRGQSHGAMAADPLARSAAAPGRSGARGVSHVGRLAQGRALLGRLLGFESGPRYAGAHLCRRNREDQCESQSVQSRADAHAHARAGDAG
jgi:hypothetical protein